MQVLALIKKHEQHLPAPVISQQVIPLATLFNRIRMRKPGGVMAREEHAGIVAAAQSAIAGLQEHLSVATEQTDVAMGLIDAAVGQTSVESGRNAMAYLAAVKEKLDEAFRATTVAFDELRRYGEGF